MPIDLKTSLIFALTALLVGLAKGGLGGVVGAMVVPLLSTTMPVLQASGLALSLLLVGDVFALRLYWKQWDMKYLRLMLPAGVIGVVMGLLLLTSLPDQVLRRLLGIMTLVVALYKLASDSLTQVTYTPRGWHGILAGWLAAFTSALANAGGPPATAYLLLQKMPPLAFLGTFSLFFAVVNFLKLPGFLTARAIDLSLLGSLLWVLPLIPVGVWLGKRLLTRLNPKAFERLMLVLLTYAGLSLLLG